MIELNHAAVAPGGLGAPRALKGHRDCPVCSAPSPEFAFRRNGFDMVRCASCSLVYVGADPASIDFQQLYGCAADFFLAEATRHYAVQGVELSQWSSVYARRELGLNVVTGTLQSAALTRAAALAGLLVLSVRSEGVAGDGWRWRNRASLLLSRAMGWGDIMRVTLAKAGAAA